MTAALGGAMVTRDLVAGGHVKAYLLLAIGIGVCVLSDCGKDGTGPVPVPAQRIVFQSRRLTGMPNLFVMNQNGDSVRAVLTGQEDDESPVLSPDAERIAFSSNRDGQWHIYVIKVDGTGLTRVTSDTFSDAQPSWAPDGTRLVFARSLATSLGAGLRIVNVDGGGLQVLTTEATDAEPAWSPDGSRIAFTRGGNIVVVNPDGAGLQPLTDTLLNAGDPAWAPDGAHIAFSSTASGVLDLFVMGADGSGVVNITQTPTEGEAQPAWSPDGAYLVFAGARRFDSENFLGNMEIVRRRADGSGEVILTDVPAEDLHPSWAQSRP
jgi:Tol biopolymer transport system component